MFKRLLSFSNPLGLAFTAAALLLLILSPEARKSTRRMLVKGAGALLSVGDQVKELTIGARKELGTIVQEEKVEKEQADLPNFSEMMKNAGENTNELFNDMKFPMEKPISTLSHSMELSEEFVENTFGESKLVHVPNHPVSHKPNKKAAPKTKSAQKQKEAQNVLSDQAFMSLMGNPPIELKKSRFLFFCLLHLKVVE